MKLIKCTNLLVLALALTCIFAGCRKRPAGLTNLPGRTSSHVPDGGLGTGPTLGSGENVTPTESGLPTSSKDWWATANQDRERLKSETVYFDFDSSSIKTSEKPKLQAVADFLKSTSVSDVRVEGHCDERGTEEYNRSLGEKRALAVREALVALGVSPDRVDTVSFGEDKPAAEGHDESAWSKNRRGEFVVLTPK
jgi:peptidoglycan-associated lipoprotein